MLNWLPRVALLNELLRHGFSARSDTGWASEDGGGLQKYYILSRGGESVIAMITGSPLRPYVDTYGEEDAVFISIARRHAEVHWAGSIAPTLEDKGALKHPALAEALGMFGIAFVVVALVANVIVFLISPSC
jgi:hypothetical protein